MPTRNFAPNRPLWVESMFWLVLMALAGGATAAPIAASNGDSPDLLSRDVRPTHYDVRLEPDAKQLRFDGQVAITLQVLKATSYLTLNAVDLEIHRVGLQGRSPDVPSRAPERIASNPTARTVTLYFHDPVAPGHYRLDIDYSGRIGTQPVGLFALDYPTGSGTQRALFTQLEAADARRVMPSWDEPAYKATFALQALIPQDMTAVSNMPVASRTQQGERTLVQFATTPRMSTYLLFLGVGRFERLAGRQDGIDVGIVTRQGAAEQGQFILQSTQAILHEYGAYFGVPYPLPKLDEIAAPGGSQFFDAMENWGAIMSFERAILLDPQIATQADRQRAFQVAAHEIAHQWFGDLVTMRWWDDVWLNESFASWMEGRTSAKLHPEWSTNLRTVSEREKAMQLDALPSSHPIVQHVRTVDQIDQAFDAITYEKGESVVRMLEAYIGSEPWRAGVSEYIRHHAYGSADSRDLWTALERSSGVPVQALAHDFTEQAGVPLLKIEHASCASGKTRLVLSQGEFTRDPPKHPARHWHLPVVAQEIGASTRTRALIGSGGGTLTVEGCGALIVNAGQVGYYRTLYTSEERTRLEAALPAISSIDQLGLMADAWELFSVGLEPADGFLELVQALPPQAQPGVWHWVADTLVDIDRLYDSDSGARAAFRRFAIAKLQPVFGSIGWLAQSDEQPPVAAARDALIQALSALGDAAVIDEARRRYAMQSSDPAAVPAALRKTILAVVARHADAATWDALHTAAAQSTTPLLRAYLYEVLASTEDAALARRALELALSAEPGPADALEMLHEVSGLHPDLAFDFSLAHLSQVISMAQGPSATTFMASLEATASSNAAAHKLEDYSREHLPLGSRQTAERVSQDIDYRARVKAERLPLVDGWLSAHAPAAIAAVRGTGLAP